jgi:hypothetical protein
MRAPDNHLHYYIFSKGRYTRKLVDENTWTMLLLAGYKIAQDGRIFDESFWWTPSRCRKHLRRKHLLYFPYQIMMTRNCTLKIRAMKGNRCPRCPQ